MKRTRCVIGVDEVGRGPLAGPVGVGVVLVPTDFDWGLLPGVGDSKQVSEVKREAIYVQAKALQKAGKLDFAVAMVAASVIDKKGIAPSIALAMERALSKVEAPHMRKKDFYTTTEVKLDGGLRAPERFLYQETIIKGDGKEQVIGLASILAKVTRDAYMCRRAALTAYAPYDFAAHKGYGTTVHRAAIAAYGLSPEHRRTFCRNIKVVVYSKFVQ